MLSVEKDEKTFASSASPRGTSREGLRRKWAVTANVYNAPTKIVRPFNFWWGPHGPDFCHYGFLFYGASPKGPN